MSGNKKSGYLKVAAFFVVHNHKASAGQTSKPKLWYDLTIPL